VEELTSILAHEMGHFKLGHIVKQMIFSFVSMAIMLFIFYFYKKPLALQSFPYGYTAICRRDIFCFLIYAYVICVVNYIKLFIKEIRV
jgi:STE24 endopeptidase